MPMTTNGPSGMSPRQLKKKPDETTLLTLFTDASFCPQTGAAGWGAWAKTRHWDRGKTFSGVVKSASDASHAELKSVANALHTLSIDKLLVGIDAVIIQNDCFWALQQLCHGLPEAEQSALEADFPDGPIKQTDEAKEVLAYIQGLTRVLGIRIYLRHVKGHARGGGRSWVNNKCDALARYQMAKERKRMGYGKK